MANKIEILENTLLKLLVRRGSDNDRQQIILSEGEIGFTTDTDRLYIGDGSTYGGIIVGNKFLGSDGDPGSAFPDAVEGDTAYNTNTGSLCAYTGGGSWDLIGLTNITAGATGSFTTNDGKAVTVTNGLITSIV